MSKVSIVHCSDYDTAKVCGAVKRAVEQTHALQRLQGDQAIGARQRKHRAQSAMGGDAADHDEIMGHFQTLHHKVLGAIAAGHTDPQRLAREELANRGHDENGKWIGFDKAAKHHGTK